MDDKSTVRDQNDHDIVDLKHIVDHQLERVMKIADRLGPSGRPLNGEEKKVIRQFLSSTWVGDLTSEMEFFFSKGSIDDVERTYITLLRTLENLI